MEYKSCIPFEHRLSDFNSFTRALMHCLSNNKQREIIIDPDVNKSYTFSQIQERIDICAENLLLAGIHSGKLLATVSGNSADIIFIYLAAVDVGARVMPLNPGYKTGEVSSHLGSRGVDAVYLDPESPNYKCIVEVAKGLHLPILNDLFTSKTKTSKKREKIAKKNHTALLLFSSGTTGPPKLVKHTHRSLIAHLEQCLCLMTWNNVQHKFALVNENDVSYGVLPYFHFGGLMTVFYMLVNGATVIVNRRFTPEEYLDNIYRFKVTATNIVPPILNILSEVPSSTEKLRTLRIIYVGAAKCEETKLRKIEERFPWMEVVQVFGLTEAGAILSMTPHKCGNRNSVGQILPGISMKISQKPHPVGEILIKSPTLMSGYKGTRVLSQTEFFPSGDLGTVDPDNFVFIEGRVKEMIKVRGWQVNPFELEEAIRSLPKVIDCAVVGVPCAINGQLPKAFVIGKVDPDEIITFVRDNFISYKQLSDVVLVDKLPTSASGKVLKRDLK